MPPPTTVSLAVTCFGLACAGARAADPLLQSWQTTNTRRYARIYENDAARLAGSPITTWSHGTTAPPPPAYGGGPIGYFVEGVAAFDNRAAFSYANASSTDRNGPR